MPGFGQPPQSSQFSSTNQPAKRNPNPPRENPISHWLREFGHAQTLEVSILMTGSDGAKQRFYSNMEIEDGQTVNMAVAARLFQQALKGDMKAIKTILDRTEGRVPRPVIIKTDTGAGADLEVWTTERLDKAERIARALDTLDIDFDEILAQQDQLDPGTDSPTDAH